jgi:hypothetical protein
MFWNLKSNARYTAETIISTFVIFRNNQCYFGYSKFDRFPFHTVLFGRDYFLDIGKVALSKLIFISKHVKESYFKSFPQLRLPQFLKCKEP